VEGRWYGAQLCSEALQVEEGQAFAVPRDLVARVETERLVVRPDRGIELAGPLFRESAHEPQRLVGRSCDRRVRQGVRRRREILALHMAETFAPPRLAQLRIR